MMKEVEIKMRFDLDNVEDQNKLSKIIDIYKADDMPASIALKTGQQFDGTASVAVPAWQPAPATVPATAPATAPAQTSQLTLEELRSLMATKQDYRPALKAKLTELGAANLRALSPDKYQEFYNFMQTL